MALKRIRLPRGQAYGKPKMYGQKHFEQKSVMAETTGNNKWLRNVTRDMCQSKETANIDQKTKATTSLEPRNVVFDRKKIKLFYRSEKTQGKQAFLYVFKLHINPFVSIIIVLYTRKI